MKKTIHLKVGGCPQDQSDLKEGATYDPNKRHNCNICGYYNNYSDEMIEIDPKTNEVVWSSIK